MPGVTPKLVSIVVAGRNDDYGKGFTDRLFRSAAHNAALFEAAGLPYEYVLAEWNPLPDRPLLAEEFVKRVPHARAVVIPPEVHRIYSLNPEMAFHEMPAKNAAIRRTLGDWVLVTNADILFSECLVRRIAGGGLSAEKLYRAHRIDVRPELAWEEIQNPGEQLTSGEGTLPPPPYLGAGGDFCLASRETWTSLRGFNERVRFSTRAKDWQFFLSAMAQSIRIEFIGDVFHLDHEGGFRNTPSAQLNGSRVHFGRNWDIEFGLPVTNSLNWGFDTLRESHPGEDSRITVLDWKDYVVSDAQDKCDRKVMEWLTCPANAADKDTALALHAICAAHREGRRLICRIRTPRFAVTLSGLDAVASRFGVPLYSDWEWPSAPGYSLHRFAPKPLKLRKDDWVLEETKEGVVLHAYGNRKPIDVLPQLVKVAQPEFNPVLARRLLYAWLRMQESGVHSLAIYGRGSHTQALLSWGLPDGMELKGIVDSTAVASEDVPSVDVFLLSSASFESDMLETCRNHSRHNVIALYGDWPANMWTTEGVECLV